MSSSFVGTAESSTKLPWKSLYGVREKENKIEQRALTLPSLWSCTAEVRAVVCVRSECSFPNDRQYPDNFRAWALLHRNHWVAEVAYHPNHHALPSHSLDQNATADVERAASCRKS